MTTHRHLLMLMMMVNWHRNVSGYMSITGSLVFEQKWSDFKAVEGTAQYKAMATNVEKSIMKHFEDDPTFGNVTVTQLREDHATKRSTREGNLAVEFNLHLRNHSVTGLGRLRDTVTFGHLGKIPVKKNSLILQGLPVYKIPKDYNSWPSGFYGLPKPITGCPSNGWEEGFRYHDTENFGNINSKSNDSHMSGDVTRHGIRQEFCMHHVDGDVEVHRAWPMGKYCIYKHNDKCPEGLQEGWISWDDENTRLDYPSTYGGAMPDGTYGKDTRIYYCCDNRGDPSVPMLLPYGKPFFLFAFKSKECQKVHQYEVSSEYLFFDDEDLANHNAHSGLHPYGLHEDLYNTKIYYCYYTPIPCDEEHRDNPACFAVFLPSDVDDGTNMMMTNKERSFRHRKAFAVGSGVGMLLMGWTAFAVFLKRLVTKRQAYHY